MITSVSSVGYQERCQVCGAAPLETVLPLGHHPLPSAYLTDVTLHEPETTYPLTVCRCSSCGLLQLDYIVDPKLVFPLSYPYQTGMTNMLVRNFQSLAETVIPALGLAPGSLVVDIGSNDGTLLRPFQERGMRALGIEPTDVAKLANQRGIETVQEYVNVTAAERIRASHGSAKLVTAANVFAHINVLAELIESIKTLLDDDGVFISESQYLMDIFEKLEFDTVYHEHLRFYTVKSLQKLFTLSGMTLVDAERISAAGGSIRAFAKKGGHPSSVRVQELIAAEEAAGLYDADAWHAFAKRAVQAKRDFMTLLQTCRKNGRIVGIGAPVRGNTLLGFVHADTSLIDWTCERTGSPKIGLFTPGTHIPVVDERRLFDEQPEYALVLSWHIGDELIKKLKELGYKGKFIVPLPEPRIVG